MSTSDSKKKGCVCVCVLPDMCCSWSGLGCWRAGSDGRGSSAGWRRSPSVRVWLLSLRSAAFSPQTSDSTRRTFPLHSCGKITFMSCDITSGHLFQLTVLRCSIDNTQKEALKSHMAGRSCDEPRWNKLQFKAVQCLTHDLTDQRWVSVHHGPQLWQHSPH